MGDALLPSPSLLDIREVWAKPVPFDCVFWRVRLGGAGVSIEPVTRRSPIFSGVLKSSPASTLALDVLHA
eukprot:4267708-Pyramimonas_sp.AAC.1